MLKQELYDILNELDESGETAGVLLADGLRDAFDSSDDADIEDDEELSEDTLELLRDEARNVAGYAQNTAEKFEDALVG